MAEERLLLAEGRILCSRLADINASDQLLAHYVAAHEARAKLLQSSDSTDQFLVGLACKGFVGFRLADGWCAFFRRSSLLRRKLVLLTALLECERASWDEIDRVTSSGFVSFVVAAMIDLVLNVVFAIAATPFVLLKAWPGSEDH